MICKLTEIITQRSGIDIITDNTLLTMVMFPFDAEKVTGVYLREGTHKICPKETILFTTNRGWCKWSVIFHELAHASGKEGRLGRVGIVNNAREYGNSIIIRMIEEQVAERTAMKLMDHFKISNENTIAKSLKYLKDYQAPSIFEEDIKKDVDRAFNYILTHWLNGLYFNPVLEEASLMDKIKEFMKVF